MSPKDIIFICYRFCDFALIFRILCDYYSLSGVLVLNQRVQRNYYNYYKSPEFNILTALKKMFKIFFFRLFYVDAKKEF